MSLYPVDSKSLACCRVGLLDSLEKESYHILQPLTAGVMVIVMENGEKLIIRCFLYFLHGKVNGK